MAIRGFELGTETDRMFADAERKRAEREVGRTEFQEVVDASGMKPMTAEEFAYAGASVAPVTGDIIAYKEAPEDFERAYELMRKGYKEKDLINLGLGTAFAGLVALGLVPGIGFVSRMGKNAARDKIRDLVEKGNLTEAADIMVKSSKTYQDKALINKQSEAQLKRLAEARIKLKEMTYKEKKKALKRLNRPENITMYHGSKGMQDTLEGTKMKRKEFLTTEGFQPYVGQGVFREKSLGNPANIKRQDTKITIDNPPGKDVLTGETYVEKKIRENKEFMKRNPSAGPVGLYSGITGYARDVKFDPNELKGIKGELGEDAFRMTGDAGKGMFNKLKDLEKSIKEKGYQPTNIKITVTEDGIPYITEGNHRLAEALKSGRPEIVADINYLRGGESVEGVLNPNLIGIGNDATTNMPTRTPFTQARGLMSSDTSGFHGEIEGVKLLSMSRDPNVSMSPSFTNPETYYSVPPDIPLLENIISAEIPYSSMRNMTPTAYEQLVRSIATDKTAQEFLQKKYFGDKPDKYGASLLPKSGHVEAELAVAFPEYFNPKSILDGDPTKKNYDMGETLIENPKTGEFDNAAMITEIRDVGKMTTPEKVQAAGMAYKKAETYLERINNIEDTIKIVETFPKQKGTLKTQKQAYDNIKNTMNSMADLAKYTSEYGARGSYDKLLQRLVTFAPEFNKFAETFPVGSEKRANLKLLATLVDTGFYGDAPAMNTIRKGFTPKKAVDGVLAEIKKGDDLGNSGVMDKAYIRDYLETDSKVTTKESGVNKMIAQKQSEKNNVNPYIDDDIKNLKKVRQNISPREAKEMFIELTSRFNRGGLVEKKGLMARN